MRFQDNFDRRFAVVTGGTRGIGAAIARMLLAEGYDVLVTYASNDEKATTFLALCRKDFPEQIIDALRVDQSSMAEVSRLVDRIKSQHRVDCFVFNAGVTLRKPFQETTNDDWQYVMNANLMSNFVIVRDLFSIFSKDSRILFIGSMMAIRPHATSIAYGVSKAALHSLAINLVKFFEGTGTTVNVIAPGFVETNWQKEKPQVIRENICKKTAANRFATPDEIADAARFCLNNPFVNGSVIEVSGGYDFK